MPLEPNVQLETSLDTFLREFGMELNNYTIQLEDNRPMDVVIKAVVTDPEKFEKLTRPREIKPKETKRPDLYQKFLKDGNDPAL